MKQALHRLKILLLSSTETSGAVDIAEAPAMPKESRTSQKSLIVRSIQELKGVPVLMDASVKTPRPRPATSRTSSDDGRSWC